MSLIQLGSRIQKAPLVKVTRLLVVYLNEFNVVCGAFRYLPYNSGLLRAYAETDPLIKRYYRFLPFLYEMDSLPKVLSKYTEPPDVAAFSVSMWNEQLNLRVAEEVSRYWPRCLIVFGGCHVPFHPKEYMEAHPFIDVCVRAEGEEPFREILLRRLETEWDFLGIPDVSFFDESQRVVENEEHRESSKDLDKYPSPYMLGLFDGLMESRKEGHLFQCILESNRGCPFRL